VQRALPTLSTGILRTGAVYPGQPDDSSVLINQLILTDRQGKGHAAVGSGGSLARSVYSSPRSRPRRSFRGQTAE